MLINNDKIRVLKRFITITYYKTQSRLSTMKISR